MTNYEATKTQLLARGHNVPPRSALHNVHTTQERGKLTKTSLAGGEVNMKVLSSSASGYLTPEVNNLSPRASN